MRFLSLFSGIEAASVAWTPLGWEPAAFSEIEPFPCSVLRHHYPHVPNLGDLTRITRQQVEALGRIDLVCGGFPCQDLSVAGKRKGLMNADGSATRSGLFFDAMRIAEWARARWTVLENVPGLFSSNDGRDFAAVVGEMAGCEFDVPPNGWENAGVAVGPRGLVEWTTLDAQYVRVESHPRAVPQRRRRVFIVRDSGSWANRPPLFLERASLCGHPAPRREAKQAAPTIPSRSTAGGGLGTDFDCDGGVVQVYPTLRAGGNRTGGDRPPGTDVDTADSLIVQTAHTLRGEGFDASEDGTGRGSPLVPVIVGQAMSSKWAKGTAGPAGDEHHNLIPVPIAFPERMSGTQCASSENVSPSLGALNSIAVATQWAVRRLTPRECERLMGLPDGHTGVPHKGKPAADGPRYKALGNSWAINAARWIGERIASVDCIAAANTEAALAQSIRAGAKEPSDG